MVHTVKQPNRKRWLTRLYQQAFQRQRQESEPLPSPRASNAPLFRIFYNCFVFASLLFKVPKFIWKKWKLGKPYPPLWARFGQKIPDPQGKPVLWLHALTIGEVRGAQPLVKQIRRDFPDLFILFTTSCTTGKEELDLHFPEVDARCYLPFDFGWIMNRWVKKLRPRILIVVEHDFWFELIAAVKRGGGKVLLVNGAFTEDHRKQYQKMEALYSKLFTLIDLYVVQNRDYQKGFERYSAKPPVIGGNLKMSAAPFPSDRVALTQTWGEGPWITLASTQPPEEEWLLNALKPLLQECRIFLAPRYLGKPSLIYHLLKKLDISFSTLDNPTSSSRLVFINRMGYLTACYSLSSIAVLGGSFSPNGKGHNLIEPYLYGCPALFGPNLANQKDMESLLLSSGAAIQVDTVSQLPPLISSLLKEEDRRQQLLEAGQKAIAMESWSASTTYRLIHPWLRAAFSETGGLPSPSISDISDA
jgi:3-deoxy-D-manno-octulosonic-acid transferase